MLDLFLFYNFFLKTSKSIYFMPKSKFQNKILFDCEMPNLERYTNNEKSCHGVKWPEGKGFFFLKFYLVWTVDFLYKALFWLFVLWGWRGVKASSTQ